ncbi:Gfo/Idh/MocA family protein [Maribacter ulvicola]|uniref:Predicted dehydrogenase n=1 Tax=Maribacter ulvicola TaxID=228959 RepID=A0A1N6Y9Z7_9FLAO|nr:Gfo/Idh/MocA family oxidoreductase [Maribacter ulvicola]SIR11336.1 Predicted dehydrogenase [Maribacter ulvicola]
MKDRRSFIKKTTLGATGVALGSFAFPAKSYSNILGANDRVILGSVGIRGRGKGLLDSFTKMHDKGVFVKTLCDVDSSLFNERVQLATNNQGGKAPKTETDMRNVFDDKDIDAVVIAAPNHWHALSTIWATQAGKHVYVEKPSSHNVWEGRKMVEAARKYNRVVQVGFQNRSISNVMQAMDFLHNGGIGEVFMARGTCFKPRNSFGRVADSTPPSSLDYDKWLGPANYRPYNEKKGHYNWHWHWDTGNGDTGNQGPHQFDVARWGLNKNVHPVKVQSMGGIFGITKEECSQETPNTQISTFEYEDGKILEFETRGRYTNGESNGNIKIGNMFYGTEGWLEINGSTWKAYKGSEKEPFAGSGMADGAAVGGDTSFRTAPDSDGHFANFITGVKSGNRLDINCDVEVGHMSTVLPLIANIAYKTGETLRFNGEFENFIDNEAADLMLTRRYRYPYIVPENV